MKIGERMKKIDFKKNIGLTLIEIMIAMAIMSLVAVMAFSIMRFADKMVKISKDEYEFQFSTRSVLESTSKTIRYSSALFTIPQSSFRPDNLSEGWDYIGLNEVEIKPANGSDPAVMGYEVVKYHFDETATPNKHIKSVLMPAQDGVRYEFVFNKINPQDVDSLLQFSIKRYQDGSVDSFGNPVPNLVIVSEVEARNALQVIDLSSPLDPGVAVAFRLEDRSKNVVGHVAMVLDKSGSMGWNVSGSNKNPNPTDQRITILKSKASALINTFAQEDNIDIQLVPFSTSANNPNAFYNAKSQTSELLTKITNLSANGGTNTGDGLRRAYHGLVVHNASVGPGVKISNYLIILVDGVTTYGSVVSNGNHTFITDASNINENRIAAGGQVIGNGSTLDADGTNYVNTIGALIKNNSFARVYVIGFSSNAADRQSVNDIALACGATSDHVYKAESDTALAEVFESIRQDIVNDLWYLQGPDL